MATTVQRVTPIEAARTLGVTTAEVYRLVLDGVLAGRIGADGDIWVDADAVSRYRPPVAATD